MKVLFIDAPPDPPWGGQESLLTLLRDLPGDIERTVFLDSPGTFLGMLGERRVHAKVVPASGLYREMRALAPDLVHCNSATTRYTFMAALAAKLCGVPFVWHNRVAESGGWKERVIAAFSARIIVISGAVEEKFRRDKAKTVKIYNGVDTGRFSPGPPPEGLRAGLGLRDGDSVVGVFSRFDRGKGHGLLLRAAALLPRRQLEGAVFLFAGDGPLRRSLAEEAAAAGLQNKIVFTGFRADIPELIRLCDVVASPSVLPEGFGRVLIEAMACGKPVVATPTGGQLEIIDDGKDGLFSAPEPAALASAIGSLLPGGDADPAALGAAAREKVLRKFDSRRTAMAVTEVYAGLLRGL